MTPEDIEQWLVALDDADEQSTVTIVAFHANDYQPRLRINSYRSDYVKALPETISGGFPSAPVILGTDGFGRSETREALRNHFEVDARFIALAALGALRQDGKIEGSVVAKAMKDFGIAEDKKNPFNS